MKSVKIMSLLFTTFFLFSCSNTSELSQQGKTIYHQSSFDKTIFTPVNENTVKKVFASDHQLMMSLLNRPMSAVQLMMLSFAQPQISQSTTRVNFVSIRGTKQQDNRQYNSTTPYSVLIAKDINAVTISGSL